MHIVINKSSLNSLHLAHCATAMCERGEFPLSSSAPAIALLAVMVVRAWRRWQQPSRVKQPGYPPSQPIHSIQSKYPVI